MALTVVAATATGAAGAAVAAVAAAVAAAALDDAVRRTLAVAVLAAELVKVAVGQGAGAVGGAPVLRGLHLDLVAVDPVRQLQHALDQALLVFVHLFFGPPDKVRVISSHWLHFCLYHITMKIDENR